MEKPLFSMEGLIHRADRESRLGQRGCVVWITGRSASGKTSAAIQAEYYLTHSGWHVCRLDGDDLRMGLSYDLDFSEEGRMENVRRAAEVAALFMEQGLIVLVSIISPTSAMREAAYTRLGRNQVIEAYVRADPALCQSRDKKQLYSNIHSEGIWKYEEPGRPDILCDSGQKSALENGRILAEAVINWERGKKPCSVSRQF